MHVTIRWTEAGDQPLADGKFTCARSVIGVVLRSNHGFRNDKIASPTSVGEQRTFGNERSFVLIASMTLVQWTSVAIQAWLALERCERDLLQVPRFENSVQAVFPLERTSSGNATTGALKP